jgi:uncharacterized protein
MEHQKGAGQRGAAQSNPAPPARNIQIAPAGDRFGMGHCSAPTDNGCDGGVFRAGARDGETGEFGELGESDATKSESSGKVGGVDLHPAKTFSENSVSSSEPWRPEDRRDKSAQTAAIAPAWKFSDAVRWFLLALVHLYRVFLSPFLGGACKFYPSCSRYAQEAIALHGAKHGSVLALKRLGRCRPFTKGGFDPVPDSAVGYEASGLIAASRDRHDYSDAEWLRTATKELV